MTVDLSSFLASIGSFFLSLFGVTDAPVEVQSLTGFFVALLLLGIGLKVLRWGLRR